MLQEASGKWTLVDYKTDRIASEGVAERALRYRTQLRVYIEAADKFLTMNLEKAFLTFLNPGILQDMLGQAKGAELTSVVEGVRDRDFAPIEGCSRPCPLAEACTKLRQVTATGRVVGCCGGGCAG